MGIRNLKKMFSPQSIVVVGAINKEHTIGFVLIRNLIQGGFNGPIMPVSKTDKAIAGILTYESIKNLPLLPDLAIICEDSDNVTEYIRQLGEEKIKAVMLIGTGESSLPDQDEYIKIAKQYDMRLLGPNSMGAIIPRLNLNASCLHVPMKHGKIAFVSQSPSLSSTVLDWTAAHGVGFSHFITMGQCHSIGLGDIIDYLGSDPFTRAILIQMESLTERRNFMSAARAAARNKPLLVLKNNQIFDYNTLTEHENMQNTIDELVYDAAFRRAGMLRVKTIAEMFAGAETLSASKPFKGNRVAIVSNGHGLNMLVTDHMDEFKGKIVTLSDETISRLKTLLKRDEIKLRNPVDMGLTCSAEKYADVYEILQKSKEVDVIFFLHSPSYVENTLECAQKLIEKHKERKGNILTCWLGEGSAYGARHLFEENNIATFQTGRMAVMAFSHMIEYLDNQKALTQTPMRVPNEIKPARTKVRKIIEKALDDSKKWLTDDETKEILKAYGIDVLPSHFVSNETEAIKVADDIGYPIVLKIVTEDDIRKSDIGGVVLSLLSPESIRVAFPL